MTIQKSVLRLVSLRGVLSFFGLEYGGECYCGNFCPLGPLQLFASACSVSRAGNSVEICAGGTPPQLIRHVIFYLSLTPPIPVTSYAYQGYFSEPSDSRALTELVL